MEYPIVKKVFGNLCGGNGLGCNSAYQFCELVDDKNQVFFPARSTDKFSEYVYTDRFKLSVYGE